MRWTSLASVVLASAACAHSVTAPGDPTKRDRVNGPVTGWFSSASGATYQIGTERNYPHSGSHAGYLNIVTPPSVGFITLTQSVRADSWRGKRIRWRGWVRYTGVGGGGSGLW